MSTPQYSTIPNALAIRDKAGNSRLLTSITTLGTPESDMLNALAVGSICMSPGNVINSTGLPGTGPAGAYVKIQNTGAVADDWMPLVNWAYYNDDLLPGVTSLIDDVQSNLDDLAAIVTDNGAATFARARPGGATLAADTNAVIHPGISKTLTRGAVFSVRIDDEATEGANFKEYEVKVVWGVDGANIYVSTLNEAGPGTLSATFSAAAGATYVALSCVSTVAGTARVMLTSWTQFNTAYQYTNTQLYGSEPTPAP